MQTPPTRFFIDSPPVHWQLLTCSDLEEYFFLRRSFMSEYGKSRKGERLKGFMNCLNRIRAYIEKGDNNDWKRSVVCGIMFLKTAIAINIQQHRLLVGKCKSSINGSLQQLGYTALPPGKEIVQEFLYRIPCFQKDSAELKKWTIRERISLINLPKDNYLESKQNHKLLESIGKPSNAKDNDVNNNANFNNIECNAKVSVNNVYNACIDADNKVENIDKIDEMNNINNVDDVNGRTRFNPLTNNIHIIKNRKQSKNELQLFGEENNDMKMMSNCGGKRYFYTLPQVMKDRERQAPNLLNSPSMDISKLGFHCPAKFRYKYVGINSAGLLQNEI